MELLIYNLQGVDEQAWAWALAELVLTTTPKQPEPPLTAAVWVVWEGPGRDFKGKGSTRGLAWEDSLHNALIALAQEGPPSQQALADQINELVAILDYRGWPVEALLNQTKPKSHDLALFVAYANQRGLQDAADWLRSL